MGLRELAAVACVIAILAGGAGYIYVSSGAVIRGQAAQLASQSTRIDALASAMNSQSVTTQTVTVPGSASTTSLVSTATSTVTSTQTLTPAPVTITSTSLATTVTHDTVTLPVCCITTTASTTQTFSTTSTATTTSTSTLISTYTVTTTSTAVAATSGAVSITSFSSSNGDSLASGAGTTLDIAVENTGPPTSATLDPYVVAYPTGASTGFITFTPSSYAVYLPSGASSWEIQAGVGINVVPGAYTIQLVVYPSGGGTTSTASLSLDVTEGTPLSGVLPFVSYNWGFYSDSLTATCTVNAYAGNVLVDLVQASGAAISSANAADTIGSVYYQQQFFSYGFMVFYANAPSNSTGYDTITVTTSTSSSLSSFCYDLRGVTLSGVYATKGNGTGISLSVTPAAYIPTPLPGGASYYAMLTLMTSDSLYPFNSGSHFLLNGNSIPSAESTYVASEFSSTAGITSTCPASTQNTGQWDEVCVAFP